MSANEMKWQPIKTAPVGEIVRVGVWWISGGKQTWEVKSAKVFEPFFFGLFKRRTYHYGHYTHWMPLPEPPLTSEASNA